VTRLAGRVASGWLRAMRSGLRAPFNAVEGLVATLTKRRLRRGVFRSVIELNQAIRAYLDAHNADPKPFRSTAPADTIIGKHQRGNVCWNHSTRRVLGRPALSPRTLVEKQQRVLPPA
jgi:hypothetical protein